MGFTRAFRVGRKLYLERVKGLVQTASVLLFAAWCQSRCALGDGVMKSGDDKVQLNDV